jgi:hypothetical protein
VNRLYRAAEWIIDTKILFAATIVFTILTYTFFSACGAIVNSAEALSPSERSSRVALDELSYLRRIKWESASTTARIR